VFDIATAAVEGALAAGATYADARVMGRKIRNLSVQNGDVQSISISEDVGVGVRALVGSSWGFQATDLLTLAGAGEAGAQATAIAQASALVGGPPLALADVPVHRDEFRTHYDEHPLEVSADEQAGLLVESTRIMLEEPKVTIATGQLGFWDVESWLVSSQGHQIHQNLIH
jgi:TldD protein